MDIRSKLEGMAGKSFVYNESIIKVKGYKFEDPDFIISTDAGPVRFSFTDLHQKLSEFKELPKAEKGLEVAGKGTGIVANSLLGGNAMHSLRDTLLENIEKVKADPNFIPQAKAINDSIGQVIDLARTEIEYHKLLKKLD